MRKALKYFQNQAIAVSPNLHQVPPTHVTESVSGGSEPSNYILVKIQSSSTKPGEAAPTFGVGDLAHRSTLDKHQAAANAVIAAGLQKHQYAYESILQGYDVYVPEPCPGISVEEEKNNIWVVYIHGGYWCDPQQLAWTFTATRAMILTHPSLKKVADQIAGYASLNYRLSQHSDFPQERSKTSEYEMREAKHPDHINDVLAALADLQQRHGFGNRYLLLGHGCGATLALQVAMSRKWTREGAVIGEGDDVVKPPIAILGIDGIYDIPLLRKGSVGLQRYRTQIEGAFGNKEEDWTAASPAAWTKYADTWKDGQLISLVHSREDELLDWDQVEMMERCWSEKQVWKDDPSQGIPMKIQEIKGRHAEIWQKGVGMAGPIADVIMTLRQAEAEQKSS